MSALSWTHTLIRQIIQIFAFEIRPKNYAKHYLIKTLMKFQAVLESGLHVHPGRAIGRVPYKVGPQHRHSFAQ